MKYNFQNGRVYCGALREKDIGRRVTVCGWVARARDIGGLIFVDMRDRYGITQIVFNNEFDAELCDAANHLGREYVIQVEGKVAERSSKNTNIATGEIEIIADKLMLQARKSLQNEDKTISQISYELGFSNQSAFGKFFRTHEGMGPREYRTTCK